jgi:hypothetical protein
MWHWQWSAFISYLDNKHGILDKFSPAVPVIAIFTKFDGLISTAYSELRDDEMDIPEAEEKAPQLAERMLNANFIQPLKTTQFQPKNYVCLKGEHICPLGELKTGNGIRHA